MLVEYLYRVNNRTEHQPVELESIFNYMTNLNNKKNIEHQLYVKTKYYREWLSNNTNATSDEISDEKQKTFVAVNFASTFQPFKEFVYDENGNVILDKKGKPKHSGTCQANETVQLSGLLILDFDKLDNIDDIRTKLQNDIHTFVVFPSPSAKGLKVLIQHDLSDVTKWKTLFAEIRDYYLKITGVPEKSLDDSGSDVSRLCYIPYVKKEEFYWKNDSWIWNYQGTFEIKHSNNYNNNGVPQEHINPEITQELYLYCFYASVYLAENQIDITEGYKNWRNLGFSLCTLGEAGKKIFHNISSVNNEYDYDRCDEMYDTLLNAFDEGKIGIEKYLSVVKKVITDFVLFGKCGVKVNNE